MQPLTTYIKNPELMDAQVVEELWQLVDRHPTYQAARLLLVRGLYQLQDERFGAALRQAALMLPDRVKLFDLIEGDRFRVQPEHRKPLRPLPDEPAADRTQSLIDSFLSGTPEEPRPRRQHPTDATVDYMSYLMQLEDAPSAPVEKSDEAEPEEDSEILTDDAEVTTEEAFDEWPEEEVKEDENVPSEAYFTETLARIYIKQCKYDKAIEIIRRLSLNYPKKSRYFADQIRFLEKLLLNERLKNNEK